MKRLSEQTLYEILEVPPGASRSEIESAYERARALYAPGSLAIYSLMSPDEAALLASRIEDAKRTLVDADARARYDASLSAPAAVAPAVDVPPAVAPAAAAPAADAPADDAPADDAPAAAPAAAPAVAVSARPQPFGPLPPVIPALKPANPDPAPPPAPEPPAAQPVILLAAAMQAAGPVAPVSRPILLMREVVPAPTPAPAEASTPPPEILNPEGSVWTGEALRKVREARGISIPQIAERTKVTRHHVENIEGDRYGALPAPVYLRGILFSLARELRLDGQRVARSYLDRAAAAAANGSGARPR